MDALTIKDLRKVYANGVEALKGIDLTVREGDFFALLGPNGAGKTTAIGIVTSLIRKSGGSVSVFGHDIERERDAAKACIGVVPQEINLNMFERNDHTLVNQAVTTACREHGSAPEYRRPCIFGTGAPVSASSLFLAFDARALVLSRAF
jgi:ABC-type multidrug transport system ATPase subunit